MQYFPQIYQKDHKKNHNFLKISLNSFNISLKLPAINFFTYFPEFLPYFQKLHRKFLEMFFKLRHIFLKFRFNFLKFP